MKPEDRERKKDWKAQQRATARADFPLPDALLEDFFLAVAAAVESDGCDHSLRATQAWIGRRKMDDAALLLWLEANGGHCDCEVVGNVLDHWEESR